MGLIGDLVKVNEKYNPLVNAANVAVDVGKGLIEFGKENRSESKSNNPVVYQPVEKKDLGEIIKDGWEDNKDKIGLTPIDTVYNFATGSKGAPSKLFSTASDVATNVLDAGNDLANDVKKSVKKYWPFAVAGVLGIVAVKAATPELVKRVLN